MAVAAQVSSKGRFVIGCDIIEADKLSNRLVSLLPGRLTCAPQTPFAWV
jgi:hypothetical protein